MTNKNPPLPPPTPVATTADVFAYLRDNLGVTVAVARDAAGATRVRVAVTLTDPATGEAHVVSDAAAD